MVGGKVIGLARGRENTLVHVEDGRDTLSVRLVERKISDGTPVAVGVGDSVWWQCGKVMWTPASLKNLPVDECGVSWDIHLPKIGYSH